MHCRKTKMVSVVPRHFLVSYNIVPSIMVRLRKVSIGLSKSHFAMYLFLGTPCSNLLLNDAFSLKFALDRFSYFA